MTKNVRREVVTAHDPLSRFDAGSVAEPVTEPASNSLQKRSSVLVEFEGADYQRLKAAAKSRGLTLRGYIRSSALERLREDERR